MGLLTLHTSWGPCGAPQAWPSEATPAGEPDTAGDGPLHPSAPLSAQTTRPLSGGQRRRNAPGSPQGPCGKEGSCPSELCGHPGSQTSISPEQEAPGSLRNHGSGVYGPWGVGGESAFSNKLTPLVWGPPAEKWWKVQEWSWYRLKSIEKEKKIRNHQTMTKQSSLRAGGESWLWVFWLPLQPERTDSNSTHMRIPPSQATRGQMGSLVW